MFSTVILNPRNSLPKVLRGISSNQKLSKKKKDAALGFCYTELHREGTEVRVKNEEWFIYIEGLLLSKASPCHFDDEERGGEI